MFDQNLTQPMRWAGGTTKGPQRVSHGQRGLSSRALVELSTVASIGNGKRGCNGTCRCTMRGRSTTMGFTGFGSGGLLKVSLRLCLALDCDRARVHVNRHVDWRVSARSAFSICTAIGPTVNTFLTITFWGFYMRGTRLRARETGGQSMLPGGWNCSLQPHQNSEALPNAAMACGRSWSRQP